MNEDLEAELYELEPPAVCPDCRGVITGVRFNGRCLSCHETHTDIYDCDLPPHDWHPLDDGSWNTL